MIIKCFSLTAMRFGFKRNETRDRKTSYRGWLAIGKQWLFDWEVPKQYEHLLKELNV